MTLRFVEADSSQPLGNVMLAFTGSPPQTYCKETAGGPTCSIVSFLLVGKETVTATHSGYQPEIVVIDGGEAGGTCGATVNNVDQTVRMRR